MLVHVYGAKCIGIDATLVTVEIDVASGIGIHLCGLADVAVKESLLRTTTALQALSYHIPGKKIVINLAPADLHKNGTGYDLPIALGILAASDPELTEGMEGYMIMGELGLDGSVRPIPGGLSIAQLAKEAGFTGCILPRESAMEAADIDGVRVYGVSTLEDAVGILRGEPREDLICSGKHFSSGGPSCPEIDFEDIIGQENAKRAIEIAAAGGHNIIMVGAPGSGKSSLAKAMGGILPPMSLEEAMVTNKIYSVAGKGSPCSGPIRNRPYRAPHCNTSAVSMIGGGSGDNVTPGEVSLAHNGVLFLDEISLIPRSVLEALRAPLEDRKVTISRLRSKVEYPASFSLVAASNPCPCGYFGEGDRCCCTPTQRENYLSRLSGPFLDRIDLQVWVKSISPTRAMERRKGEPSSAVAARVAAARQIQKARFDREDISCNAQMNNKAIEKYCPLSEDTRQTLNTVISSGNYSMRAYFRIIKVARTIADLEGKPEIEPQHICEAAGFRFLDRPAR